jgi:caffeoyl-CoA O-methyltransferase
MSSRSTTVTPAHFEYVAARTRGDDAFLKSLKAAAVEAGIPEIQIAPEQAALMQILLRASKAREVIEVGTLAGYSAIQMARALPEGGRVRTIELDPLHVKFAREWIAESDVKDKVVVMEGKGAEVLATMADNGADAAFLDADKGNYPVYLEESLRIVKPGGLILVDNAFAFGQILDAKPTDREADAVKRFNEIMAREPRVQAVIVPIGDGLWVGVKR